MLKTAPHTVPCSPFAAFATSVPAPYNSALSYQALYGRRLAFLRDPPILDNDQETDTSDRSREQRSREIIRETTIQATAPPKTNRALHINATPPGQVPNCDGDLVDIPPTGHNKGRQGSLERP
eukprot:1572592-Pyramimonas_sp.AAC.1